MKVSSNKKKLTKINPFSFDNKKPKRLTQTKNKDIKNIKILYDYNTKLNKTITEFRKVNLLKPELTVQKPNIVSQDSNSDIIKYLEKELNLIDSEKHINDVVKIFEIFQEELISKLEDKYNDLKINKIMKNNFEIIIKYILNIFTIYKKKYKECISLIKNKINNLSEIVKDKRSIINNYTNNNNNIIILDKNIKQYILNQEENVVNLINSLSTTIKTFNNKYKLLIINIENNLDSFNNKLIEIKNRFNSLNKNNAVTFNYNITTKNLNFIEINKDLEKIYLTNINLNKEIKLLDNNHKLFFEEAKEIFNNLRINHKNKLKKYQKLFESFQNIKINKEKGKSELKYLKLNLSKIKNIRTRNLNDNFSTSLNITTNSFKKNKLNINLNNSQNSSKIKHNNSFNGTNTLQIKKINNISFYKSEDNNNNIEIYYISQLMLEFFDKLKILQKAIINKEPNIIQQKKEFEKYKKGIIKYLKNLSNKNHKISFIKNIIVKEIEYSIITNKINEQIINKENNIIFKDIIFKVMDLINNYSKENEKEKKEENKENNVNNIEEKIQKFFIKLNKDINELKESNEKLKNELNQYKNIKSKKSLIFESGKDLTFRDKNNINDLNNKIESIEEESTNKNNITGSFEKLENFDNLNINEEIINFQINLQNRIKYLEKEIETEKNKNLKFFMELNSGNDNNINNQYSNLVKLYQDELEKNKILKEKYILEIEDINNNLIKYYKNMNNNDDIINISENNNINNNDGNLNYNYSNFSLNLSLTKAEIKELKNKLNEKEEKINELQQKIENQTLILKEKIYNPLRKALELLITEINLNDKIKEILKGMLFIFQYTNEEIVKIFEYKEKNMNIIGLFKI